MQSRAKGAHQRLISGSSDAHQRQSVAIREIAPEGAHQMLISDNQWPSREIAPEGAHRRMATGACPQPRTPPHPSCCRRRRRRRRHRRHRHRYRRHRRRHLSAGGVTATWKARASPDEGDHQHALSEASRMQSGEPLPCLEGASLASCHSLKSSVVARRCRM